MLIGTTGCTAEEAEAAFTAGKLDAVAFGNSFLANPDLPERIKMTSALNTPDISTFYTPGALGLDLIASATFGGVHGSVGRLQQRLQ